MKRTDIVKKIMSELFEDDIVIASTGYISREVFKYDRPLNFYMQGSMGNALAIGLGLAFNVRQRVIVINGDGSALMSLGSMVTAKKARLHNLVHYILDNGCHESTGGQPTNSNLVDFHYLGKNVVVYKMGKDESIPPRITLTPEQITKRFKSEILRLQKQSKAS